VPFLFLNRRTEGTKRTLFLDDEVAVGLAVAHLAELGHRVIGHIAGKKHMETGRRRQKGFRDAMRKVGLPFDPTLAVEGDYTMAGGEAAFNEIRQRSIRPTALVVSEFVMGVGALGAARRAGIDVPRELSLVAFNNLDIASYLTPKLTTVSVSLGDLGQEGLELLVTRPPDEEIEQMVSVPAQLFVRESTSPPRPSRRTR
jgi:LacI family transcriptional regulator